jgi:hypothetical protein
MALVNGTPIAVTGTAAQIGTPGVSRDVLGISVPTGGNTVYIGGSNVTTTNGIPIAAGSVVWMTRDGLAPSASMAWFAVCATTQTITFVEGS